MEDEDGFPCLVSADWWPGFRQARPKKKFFNASGGIDINSAGDMAPIILIIKPTVYDMEISDVVVVFAIQKVVQLKNKRRKDKLSTWKQFDMKCIPFGS